MAEHQLDYTRSYSHWHDDSDEHFRSQITNSRAYFQTFMPPNKNAAILEIGCGMGFAIGTMQSLGYHDVEAMDSDEGQVEACQKRGLPVVLIPTNETLDYLNERKQTKDLVLAIDVLEHIPRHQQLSFLKAVRQTLKPGGLFICQVPNANSSIATRYRYIDWTHELSFSETSLDFVLYNAGFSNISIREAGITTTPRLPFIPRPASWFWMWWLQKLSRFIRRLTLASEIGWDEAKRLPLSPNILAIAKA
jgi:2-polyprenyl-3-methyl-5-hydroxy-6-metoxy-1,4-benzoquinol methylase